MLDTALLHRAAHLLSLIPPDVPADQVLRRELGAARELEPEDKRALAEAIHAYFRWTGWLDHEAPVTSRIASALDLQRKFDANPGFIKAETLATRAVPAWLPAEMELPHFWLRSLQTAPPLWLRAQKEFAVALPRTLGHCTPPPDLGAFVPGLPPAALSTALRFHGSRDLFTTPEFKNGVFEIQDLASQIVGHAAAARPGETWWDACAGEGGKTLHLADLMDNKGLLWASDRHTGRLATLRKRAARAQVFNYRSVIWNGGPSLPTKTKFDGILLDAPCSGVGTWQRHPQARWTTTSTDVAELAELQLQLLRHVVPALKPGGRLLYAVCTLTRRETTAVADAFAAHHPECVPAPLFPGHPATRLTLWPHEIGANGMFLAAWQKQA